MDVVALGAARVAYDLTEAHESLTTSLELHRLGDQHALRRRSQRRDEVRTGSSKPNECNRVCGADPAGPELLEEGGSLWGLPSSSTRTPDPTNSMQVHPDGWIVVG